MTTDPTSPAPTPGRATLGDLEISWLEWGRAGDPLALCVHGFPDTPHTFRHLGPALAEAGFRVVAPWLRGYAPSAVPENGNYRVSALVGDAVGLADHLEAGSDAVFVGHDWGAIIGYATVATHPERFARLVTLAVPPLSTVMTGFFTYAQIRRSWYMFVFQHALAEAVVAADDLAFIDGLWADWSPGYDGAADLAHVKDALRDPANLAAALGYYRAMLGDDQTGATDADQAALLPSPVPTLYLHGADDGCMGAELVGGAAAALPEPGSRVEIVEDTGHFLQLEDPAAVNHLITGFLTA